MPFKLNGNTGKIGLTLGFILSLLIFAMAQSQANGNRDKAIEILEKNDVLMDKNIDKTEEAVVQIQLDVNSIQDDVGNTADDVKEMKADLKEFIRVQQTLNNKFIEHILTDNN